MHASSDVCSAQLLEGGPHLVHRQQVIRVLNRQLEALIRKFRLRRRIAPLKGRLHSLLPRRVEPLPRLLLTVQSIARTWWEGQPGLEDVKMVDVKRRTRALRGAEVAGSGLTKYV